MNYKTKGNKKIEAMIIGMELKDYPSWFHMGVMNKKILYETEVEDNRVLVSKVKIKNIYGGLDLGFKDKDYICQGVAKEIFICRKAIFEFLYEEDIKK